MPVIVKTDERCAVCKAYVDLYPEGKRCRCLPKPLATPEDRDTAPNPERLTVWHLRGTDKLAVATKVTARKGDDLWVIRVLCGGAASIEPMPLSECARKLDTLSVDEGCVWDRYSFDSPTKFFEFASAISPPYYYPDSCIQPQ
jgi:hypothetical protein